MSDRDPPPGQGFGFRAHAALVVLFLIYLSDYAVRYVLSGMIDFIKQDWHITDAQAGSLMSVVLLFITVFTVPASILIDRWSRRKMISLMVFFWTLATLACALAKNYTQLLVARAFLGVGEAGYAPAGTAILAAVYSEERRAKVMGVWNASIPLGVLVGLLAGGWVARTWGWSRAFAVVALPGLVLAVAAWFLPDYKTVHAEQSMTGVRDLKAFFRKALRVLSVPSLALTYLGFAMNVATTTALMTWLPTYFERTGLAEQGKGSLYALPAFALVLIGAPLGGFLSDAWRRNRREARLLFPALSSLTAGAVLLTALLFEANPVQVAILAVFGIVASCYIAPAASATQDLVHPGLRAFSYGMCVIVQHLCGDAWSPWLVGALSDRIGLSRALLTLPALAVLAFSCFWGASRFYNRDLEKVERVELEAE